MLKAERIADLISAETEIQRLQAVKVMKGNSSEKFNQLRDKLLKILSFVEAKIDFPEEDLPEENLNKIRGLNRKVEIIVQPYDPPRQLVSKPVKKTTEEKLQGDLKEGDKILLENILFKTGYSYLTKESKIRLDRIADVLVERKDIYFTVEGHVCCTYGARDAIDRKTKKRNLSVARAKTVYDFLARKGVSRSRMRYVGLKRKYPLGGEPAYDRRVEIQVTQINKTTN